MTAPPLTTAQRQELWRQRKAKEHKTWREALQQIHEAKTLRTAKKLAAKALGLTLSLPDKP